MPISAIFAKLARLLLICLQAPNAARPTGKIRQMKTPSPIQPEAKGTKVGATISMLMIVAFGLSSYLNHQDNEHRHAAAEHSNRPTVISAYFA